MLDGKHMHELSTINDAINRMVTNIHQAKMVKSPVVNGSVNGSDKFTNFNQAKLKLRKPLMAPL